eukprot:2186449-Alexandrium_andersonii.AAC.1
MTRPWFFPFDERLERLFARVELVCAEELPSVRHAKVAMPALSEPAEYVTIIGTTWGVLSALDVGRMVQIYANQTIHPVHANGITRGIRQALADDDPDTVA